MYKFFPQHSNPFFFTQTLIFTDIFFSLDTMNQASTSKRSRITQPAPRTVISGMAPLNGSFVNRVFSIEGLRDHILSFQDLKDRGLTKRLNKTFQSEGYKRDDYISRDIQDLFGEHLLVSHGTFLTIHIGQGTASKQRRGWVIECTRDSMGFLFDEGVWTRVGGVSTHILNDPITGAVETLAIEPIKFWKEEVRFFVNFFENTFQHFFVFRCFRFYRAFIRGLDLL
jgi:hypothetical protein